MSEMSTKLKKLEVFFIMRLFVFVPLSKPNRALSFYASSNLGFVKHYTWCAFGLDELMSANVEKLVK